MDLKAARLLVTGGSDFHGHGEDPEAEARERLGKVALPDDAWERFDAALRRRMEGSR